MRIPRKLIIPTTILIVLAIGLLLYLPHGHSSKTILRGNTVTLIGTISSTTCPAHADVGCSIIVNGFTVPIVHGFTATPDLGTVTGYSADKPILGQVAHIYAEKIDAHNASIFNSARYYVHISN